MIEMDGAQGEGGGQILRSTLALSLLTRTPVRIRNIRAGRSRPGLLRQHLCCVQAAVRVGNGRAEGAELGSKDLTFEPGPIVAGVYELKVGSAGSTTLVLQTVLPPLLSAGAASTVIVEGGTHNPSAPPSTFLAGAFGRILARMGAPLDVRTERVGLYPAGGGRVALGVGAHGKLVPLRLLDRGPVRSIRGTILVAGVPASVAARESRVLQDRLRIAPEHVEVQTLGAATGPGNVVIVEIDCEESTEVFMALGARGKPAEKVANEVCDAAARWLLADVPVDAHLADQLLLPMAMAGGGVFRTTEPTPHTTTNAAVVERFLGLPTRFVDEGAGAYRVEVGTAP